MPRQMLVGKQTALGRSTLLLRMQSMPCWSSGIMTETGRMETSLPIRHYEATNSFGGAAKVVQKARCTAGKLRQPHVPLAEVALFVLGRSCVSATLWKLFVLTLLLTLTVKQMVSVLLMSRALQKSSIAGCQISLRLKSALSISAHCTQGGKSRQLEDEHDLCAYGSHASYIDLCLLHIHMHAVYIHMHCSQQFHVWCV